MVEPFNLLQQTPVEGRGRRVNKSPDWNYNQEYYYRNRERLLAQAKARRQANPELIKTRNRANYEKRRDKINARQREFYANNRAYCKAKNEKHRKAYRERHREELNEKQKRQYRENPEVKVRKREIQRRARARQHDLNPKRYTDIATCPDTGNTFEQVRLIGTAGKSVRTFCKICNHIHRLVAGKETK